MKKIKDSIAGILYRILLIIVKLIPAKSGDKHLLVIKLDEIGDFMLFRNNLKYLKEAKKFNGYSITLVGNDAWRPIFDHFDRNTVDRIVWVNKKKFKKDLLYRFSILLEVRKLQTSEVVNGVFSRSIILDDGFAFVAPGKVKVAMEEDKINTNRGRGAINFNNVIYTRFIDCGLEPNFEALRNNIFYNVYLEMKIVPELSLPKVHGKNTPNIPYYVIFLGAGNKVEREWPVQHFVDSANYVAARSALVPVLCGTPAEKVTGNEFCKLYGRECINLVGETTLVSFIELTAKAAFMLSVDTGTVHMAASVNCPVIALYSGVHYMRYGPYPKILGKVFFAVYSDLVDGYIEAKDPVVFDSFTMKNEYIREISTAKVFPLLDHVLALNHQ